MKSNQTFTLVFDKEFQQGEYYIGGFDSSVSQSFSAQIKTKRKQQYGIKKAKGFNRVINTGWSYIIERI